jgi:hypothetical protein
MIKQHVAQALDVSEDFWAEPEATSIQSDSEVTKIILGHRPMRDYPLHHLAETIENGYATLKKSHQLVPSHRVPLSPCHDYGESRYSDG